MVRVPSKLRRCRDLTAVSRLVGRDPRYAYSMKRLRSTETHEQHFLLSAPATLALAIDAEGVEFPEDRPLEVLLLNAGSRELIDRGQWFRFVPSMLESSGSLSVTAFLSESHSSDIRSRVPDALVSGQSVDLRAVSSRPHDVLSAHPRDYSLAVLFSQLPNPDHLLADLKAFRALSIPFYFASFSSTHALLNHAILRACRAFAEPVVSPNPFALVSQRVGENWNRVLSRVPVCSLPSFDDKIDEEYFHALSVTTQMVLNSHRLGEPSQDWAVGARADDGLVHTLDGVFVSLDTRQVVDRNSGDVLGVLNDQWSEVLMEYDPDWDEVDRLIWASHIRFFALSDGIATRADLEAA